MNTPSLPTPTVSYADRNFATRKCSVQSAILVLGLSSLLLAGCATQPPREEREVPLQASIVSAAKALNGAERQIRDAGLKTYGLRPTKATIIFELATARGEQNSAQLNVVGSPTLGGGGLGWSATRSVTKGSHIEIEFTPTNK